MKSLLNLSESEYRVFTELFNYLDGEASGVLNTSQVYELLVTSALPADVLMQVGG